MPVLLVIRSASAPIDPLKPRDPGLSEIRWSLIGTTTPQAIGGCRVAILLARRSGRDAALAFIADRVNQLHARTDAAADEERHVAERAPDWLLAL